jgi:asparagine synthase (glutamine-hydrolysing)
VGIVGAFNLDRRPVTLLEVQTLSEASRHRASGGEDFSVHSSFGVAFQYPRARPAPDTERCLLRSAAGEVIAFDGRLDNRDELAALDDQQGDRDPRSDAALALAAYRRAGARFASFANGDFAIALFDPRQPALFLARDVMGTRPLYYCRSGERVLFASEIKSLLADPRVPRKPDAEALADLVLDRWDDGRRTCFDGIHSVPPGYVLIASSRRMTLERHWSFETTRELRYRDASQYVEHFRSVFEQAVKRRLRGAARVAIAVSGGVDSSSVYCQAEALARRDPSMSRPRGISMTFPRGSAADESGFLADIERHCGSSITRLAISGLRLLDDADAVVNRVEMPVVVWNAMHRTIAQARQEGCDVFLEGYFGDQMTFARKYLVDLARRGRWLTVARDLRAFGAWMADAGPRFFVHEFRRTLMRSCCPDWIFDAVRKKATSRRLARYPAWYCRGFLDPVLHRQLTRFESPPCSSLHAEEYFRRATAGYELAHVAHQTRVGLMSGVEVLYPFRDRDLVAFLMAIPGETVNLDGVPKGLLRRAVNGIVPDAVRNRRWKADFTVVHREALLRDRATILQLLTRNSAVVQAGFVDAAAMEHLGATMDRWIAERGDTNMTWHLGNLLGLEIWLRQFFGDRFALQAA